MAMPGYGSIDPSLPPEIDAEQKRIAQQQAIAEAMLQRSMQPLPTNAGPLHWTQALAQVVNARQGRHDMDAAAKARTGLGQQYQQGLADEVKRISAMRQGQAIPPDPQEMEQASDQGTPMPRTGTTGNPKAAIEAALLSQYAPVRQMGALEHKTFENEQTKAADREARLHERILALDAAAANQTAAREARAAAAAESAQLRRELASMQDTTRRDIARAAADAKSEPRPKLKPGERFKPGTEEVEAIPGSDLYIAQSGKHGKDYAAVQAVDTKMENAMAKIDKILAPENKAAFERNFGGYNALITERFPGAQDMRKEIDSLKSNLKSAGLEMIRQGGSIGTMTEKEWPIVEQMIAAIGPTLSEPEARDKLGQVKAYLQRIKANAGDAYDTEWSRTQFYKPRKAAGAPATAGKPPAGVDQAIWNAMTPEERALWPK